MPLTTPTASHSESPNFASVGLFLSCFQNGNSWLSLLFVTGYLKPFFVPPTALSKFEDAECGDFLNFLKYHSRLDTVTTTKTRTTATSSAYCVKSIAFGCLFVDNLF